MSSLVSFPQKNTWWNLMAQEIILVCSTGQKWNFYFRGLLFTSHWLNLQHWTGFYIAVYGDFQGLFFFSFRGLFYAFRGWNRPEQPCTFFPAAQSEIINWTFLIFNFFEHFLANHTHPREFLCHIQWPPFNRDTDKGEHLVNRDCLSDTNQLLANASLCKCFLG